MLTYNLEKIQRIRKYEHGWFDPIHDHGEVFDKEFLDKIEELINFLDHKDIELFPLCDGGIQIEYTKYCLIEEYIEFEIYQNKNIVHIWISLDKEKEEKSFDFEYDMNKINTIINIFIIKGYRETIEYLN